MDGFEKFNVQATVKAPLEKVWKYWTESEHIKNWNNASSDWHTPHADNDLSVGGKFSYRMEEKDTGEGFDFGGTYDEIIPHEKIVYTLGDGRQVSTTFINDETDKIKILQNVEAETMNEVEVQQEGW